MNAITTSLKERIIASLGQVTGLVAAIAVQGETGSTVLAEGSGLLLLLAVEDGSAEESTTHYILEGMRIQERRIPCTDLENRLLNRDETTLIQWMLQGEIWVDPQAYLTKIRNGLQSYPEDVLEQQLLAEFSMFLKRYLQCKDFLHTDQILDAYSAILRAIHHWARIAVLEEGLYPEFRIWQQVRRYNYGVYKLYEELTASSETLKQRVELVLLASEFSVMSKMESCCSLLIRILEESAEPMGVQELRRHPALKGKIGSNLPLLLNKLARKALIREVAVATDAELLSLEVKYTK